MKTNFLVQSLRILFISLSLTICVSAQNRVTISGTIITVNNKIVPNVTVIAETSNGKLTVISNKEGKFSLNLPNVSSIRFEGKNISPFEKTFSANEKTTDLRIEIRFIIAPVHEELFKLSAGRFG